MEVGIPFLMTVTTDDEANLRSVDKKYKELRRL